MKKTVIIIIALLASFSYGCKDELQDSLYDQMYFTDYEGGDIRFLGISFGSMNGDGYYPCNYQVMTYLPEWPRGVLQFRYGMDHFFEPDSAFVLNDVNFSSTIINGYFGFRGEIFHPGNTFYFRACYLTDEGQMYYSDEATFVP